MVYLKTEVQQCIIHQIRNSTEQICNSTEYVSYKDIKALSGYCHDYRIFFIDGLDCTNCCHSTGDLQMMEFICNQ